ncbi:hypothetical protein CAAN1_28S00848 [[Candida] anglica]|uniref:Transmembrane protein n=1 Tax=[Candida] anglica TaxID=148631 RepID=A0ABP0EM86_9ASCO
MRSSSLSKEKLEEYESQLFHSGLIGGLEGTLGGLLSGFYFNHKYNYGVNARFFTLPIKIFYVSSLCVAGIVFSTNIERSKIQKMMQKEHKLRRDIFLEEELGRPKNNN